jgi:hypothetical protein
MEKIPFSVYDFFGYLASGFLLLVSLDFAFNSELLLSQELTIVLGIFWIIVAYIAGHVVANLSGYIIEEKIVRGVLGEPSKILFNSNSNMKKRFTKLFPGFYKQLPKDTQDRILKNAKKKAGIEGSGSALFYHCHPIVKKDPATLSRLNTFLNLYGFCRNLTMSLIIVLLILVAGVINDRVAGENFSPEKLWWAVAAIIGAIGMFYRYLKFFRHYAVEVFITYAES